MKKLLALTMLALAVPAFGQYQMVRGQLYAIEDFGRNKLPDKFEIVAVRYDVVICRSYKEIATTYATTGGNGKFHGAATQINKQFATEVFAITNFAHAAAVGDDFTKTIYAMPVGQIVYYNGSIPMSAVLYDCGRYYEAPPKPLTPEQLDARKAAQLKIFTAMAARATNGDLYAQYDLGTAYLTGKNCETNREAALYWLRKAMSGGNRDAAAKLEKISETNAVATTVEGSK